MFALRSLITAAALIVATVAAPAAELIKPPALMRGDRVMLVAPSGPRTQAQVDTMAEGLRSFGFEVVVHPDVLARGGYLAGTDEQRAGMVMDAFRDPTIRAVIPVTGGYGTTRFLNALDYDVIRANPKVLLCFSDITGLHLALAAHGVVSFHSPYPNPTYLTEEGRIWNHDMLLQAIMDPSDIEGSPTPGYEMRANDAQTTPVKTIVGGIARGPLHGGNLSLIAATMGTPYEVQTKGAILFLEDVGEEPYRVDRMLSTLELAGKLDELAGVVLGHWRRCEPSNPERSFTLEEVFDRYFAHRGIPTVLYFPVGHVRENGTFPLGVMAELDADAGVLRVLERPTVPRGEGPGS